MEDRVRALMAKTLKISPELINDDTAPGTVSGWDSLAQMELVAALENEFDISIDDAEIDEMINFRIIVAIIETYVDDE